MSSGRGAGKLVKTLYVHACIQGKPCVMQWYELDLEDVAVCKSPNLPSAPIPPTACISPTILLYNNSKIFLIGGACEGADIWLDVCYYPSDAQHHRSVFYFDLQNQSGKGKGKGEWEWKRAARLRYPRWKPTAVTLNGIIYGFGGVPLQAPFAEFYDIKTKKWKILQGPSELVEPDDSVSPAVVVDSPRSRLLMQFRSNHSLYAYNVKDRSWVCLSEDFHHCLEEAVTVDNVLYWLTPVTGSDRYRFADDECSLCAYDLENNKYLSVKWESHANLLVTSTAKLIHRGQDNLCLVWYAFIDLVERLQVMKFRVGKDKNDPGKVYATTGTPAFRFVRWKKNGDLS